MSENKTSAVASYKKRPLWQWLLIYAVVAVVAYGLIYYFVIAKKTSNPYSQKQTTSSTQTEELTTVDVILTDTGFSPQTVTLKAGTKVNWTNKSGKTATVNSADHPTHLKYPALNLGNFSDGETLSLVFDKPGTYGYHNHLDSSQYGKIVVE
ncbi:MAG: hypothetical protein US62_C0002G0032 [Candidatus Woesebacteria bacterium GW2011_GWA1_37_8]|uniref:EfeO-type cupredoxin-like domain-containing protein n=2 Tax=Candidatus Woeseibacteriota TaxID=1752722 RepID=A0A0G0L923_9BACT|nr:MAG: hypothetical protein US39_C0009G0030 [Microgenomates group bacterium GW2011_GWC1_37_12b]KKQ46349.1 MAG: hypothetical protein US62_C0002G0032 [Candidatus Woesebacteria bacterium GW2011_GWA1_37_8]KKQ87507.1 MAG: hypothetical protein UT10_C0005G0030 [Candidatus Woesebacteria bacterium GW2011_GWB1_38_8b]